MMKMMLTGMAKKLRDRAKRKTPERRKTPKLSDETASKILALHIEQATYGKWK